MDDTKNGEREIKIGKRLLKKEFNVAISNGYSDEYGMYYLVDKKDDDFFSYYTSNRYLEGLDIEDIVHSVAVEELVDFNKIQKKLNPKPDSVYGKEFGFDYSEILSILKKFKPVKFEIIMIFYTNILHFNNHEKRNEVWYFYRFTNKSKILYAQCVRFNKPLKKDIFQKFDKIKVNKFEYLYDKTRIVKSIKRRYTNYKKLKSDMVRIFEKLIPTVESESDSFIYVEDDIPFSPYDDYNNLHFPRLERRSIKEIFDYLKVLKREVREINECYELLGTVLPKIDKKEVMD